MLAQAGFEPDPSDPRSAYLTRPGGERVRVFLKRMRSLKRRAVELSAQALLREQAPAVPLPRVELVFEIGSEPYLALSYLDGSNLSDLLSPGPRPLPRAPWYEPANLPEKPPLAALLPVLNEAGRAVRALHGVRVGAFGFLPGCGDEPNPHRDSARAFTAQEIAHRVGLGLDKATLPPALAEAAQRWADIEVERLSDGEPPCLVHFDLHTANIRAVLDGGRWRLRALFDFEVARGWLPEWDLAIMAWDLDSLDGDEPPGSAWQAFLDGYGPVDPGRLRLFQFVYLLTTTAYLDRYPAWGRWGLARLGEWL